jgi:predicted helicase
LDITLSETGYDFKKGKGKRLGVYLTNSLEEPTEIKRDLFSQWLSTESVEANKVKKEKPIMVVMGNPPYSVSSSNKGEWIETLMEDYKKDLNERNIQPLSDDYIKFIRYAQWFIEKNGEGIVAYISNNSFLDGIIHRQMRKSLLEKFDKIYILNLHGNSLKKEKTPEGGKDENVFDIRTGVSINILIKNRKNKKALGEVFYSDLWGDREEKYKFLNTKNIKEIEYEKLNYRKPDYFFVEKDYHALENYNEGLKVRSIFKESSMGIASGKDKEYVGFTEEDLGQFNKERIQDFLYRLFDKRKIIFDNDLLQRARWKINQNVLKENISLCFVRQSKIKGPETTISSDLICRDCVTNHTYFAPLYLYNDGNSLNLSVDNKKVCNLNSGIVSEVSEQLDLQFLQDHKHPDAGKKGTFNPLDVLDYIYAILHSPTYRERYKEFLKIDFPRIPFTSDKKLFWKLVEKGRELRKYHLMEHDKSNKLITKFPVSGSNVVSNRLTKTDPGFKLIDKEKKLGRVWINEEQYFDNVPELAWNFYIGGYQPAQKWVKDRRDRKLSYDEIEHYQKIIVALVNTDRIMKEIDEVIQEWPIK